MCIQVRILAYGEGKKIIKGVTKAATQAGIKVVVEECTHFSASLFARGNYYPEHAMVPTLTLTLVITLF